MQPLNTTRQFARLSAIGTTLAMMAFSFDALAADATDQVAEPAFDNTRFEPQQAEPKWGLIIGAGAMYAPEYEGSGDFKVSPIPAVIITYGDWLTIDPRGVSVTVLEHNGFSLAGKVGYEMGRDEDDSNRLRGLGDIDFAATIGAKATYKWEGLEIYAELDQTIDGSESLIGTVGAEYTAPVNESFFVGAGVSATVANDKHMQSYFGVTPAQSEFSGLRKYEPDAGLKRVDFTATATYMVTKNWLVRGEAGLGVLIGDAADSPIVAEKIQPSFMAVVGYKF
ncbi:outer membrane scaffolding protein for murein synthesis (MipA/OmpV family) [Rhizobium sp. PP-F2F-G38]|nr:outer membrane scaffolding protein for murein synthesis (MipA/OmpV family) [Rhizobium sp. PP-WC-1G-195]PYE39544.1 outer membrane scaffolding protein for murein synthesis (MipA/OmpV family) [Rhizobium sp. PP-F2F-G20b]PYE93293.1 outer membrane scaffolding protein for murein synthesis (MipA/OmpV family) [Rhizobium sp. PP-F2F-G38]TCL89403.1 outer membrane scaffolding protein for murein synthesis (MipA/OmpV family) [Rhizobium sp. PP-WC-2G-219]TCQ00589.1 outer membrane scaffolding protein for mure